jgi:hypothetical protein
MAETYPDYAKFTSDVFKAWEKGMSRWWDDVLDSPVFMEQVGKNLSRMVKTRSVVDKTIDQSLSVMHLPTRADFTRLGRVVTLLEEKLLSVEDQVLDLSDALAASRKEALQARVEAAEARVELREALARIEAMLTNDSAPRKRTKEA